MMTLKGKILVETDKAIRFQILEDECMHLQGQIEWFPKSKTKILKRKDGEIRTINVQNWLYDDKIIINEWER